jgi:putative ABC transport system permease protein
MTVSLPGSRYGEAQQRVQFFQRLFTKVDALPGVQYAGAISFLPLAGGGAATSYEVVGQPAPPRGQEPVTDVRVITNKYLQAMGTDLIRGRLFDEANADDAKNRVVVNETLARKHWPNEDPLGKRIKISWNDTREDEIVGVVRDVKNTSLETETRPTIYWPHPRFPYNGMTLAIRTATDPSSIVNSVLSIVREQDPLLAVADIRTMDEVLSRSVAQRRLVMTMLAVFAAAALVLAAVGIYGVIAYGVTQRTQEIGIRMALGAQRTDVLRMVVGGAMTLAAAGIVIGGVSAYLLTTLMTKLLFDVQPGDPATFAAVAGVLVLVAAAASYIPGLRATRVDPVVALRSE